MKKLIVIVILLLFPQICFGQAFVSNGRSAPSKYTQLLLRSQGGISGSPLIRDYSRKDYTTGALRSGKTITNNASNVTYSTSYKKFGNVSMRFPGTSGSYLEIATDADLQLANVNYTVEAWIRFDATNVDYMPWAISPYNTSIMGLTLFNYPTGTTNYVYWPGGYSGFTMAYTSTQWHHIAMQQTDLYLDVYLDGVSVYSVNTVIGGADGGPTRIGQSAIYPDSYVFAGYIDSLRVTKGKALYPENAGSFTPPTRGF